MTLMYRDSFIFFFNRYTICQEVSNFKCEGTGERFAHASDIAAVARRRQQRRSDRRVQCASDENVIRWWCRPWIDRSRGVRESERERRGESEKNKHLRDGGGVDSLSLWQGRIFCVCVRARASERERNKQRGKKRERERKKERRAKRRVRVRSTASRRTRTGSSSTVTK